jgi:hypothetical protein
MKRLSLLAAAVVLSGVSAANAASVTFTLDLSAGGGNFTLYGETSAGDNAGLAAYNVALTNVATVNHNSLRNAAAESSDGSLAGPVGFTLFRSADDTNAAVGPVLIQGSQDTIAPTPFIIYGLGQAPGDLTSRNIITAGSKEGDPWAAKMVIATGTYAAGGQFPDFDPTAAVLTSANLFNDNAGLAVTAAATVNTIVIPIPEPGTLAMAGMSLIGLAVRRRFLA